MTTRRSTFTATRAVLAAAAACSVLLAACAAPTNQATPPPTSSSTVSSSPAPKSGPPITVPGLSSSVKSSSPAPTTSAAPSTTAPLTSAITSAVTTAAPAPPPVRTAQQAPPTDTPEPQPATTPEPTTAAAPPTPATRDPAPRGPVSGGKTVVIDPGHNGGNASAPDIINKLVPAGFGQTKPCNTTGTATDDGYPEHEFTWAVANDLRPLLEAQGITVVMTRDSDDGVGPCVNERAAIGNENNADVVVSIHGDGDEASANGFYVMTAEQDPAGAEMAARSRSLAVDVRDGLVSAGLSPSNHLGSDGLWPRNDLAGLNLSLRPTVMIEAGNMRNPADAALMSSDAGHQQVAQGLANGVLNYLGAG
jgi:N-acetylmuramoyl-L-alanine amidase